MGLKLLHVCSVNSAKPTLRMSNLRSPTFQVSTMQISQLTLRLALNKTGNQKGKEKPAKILTPLYAL